MTLLLGVIHTPSEQSLRLGYDGQISVPSRGTLSEDASNAR